MSRVSESNRESASQEEIATVSQKLSDLCGLLRKSAMTRLSIFCTIRITTTFTLLFLILTTDMSVTLVLLDSRLNSCRCG